MIDDRASGDNYSTWRIQPIQYALDTNKCSFLIMGPR